MPRHRDPDLAALVAAAIEADPRITAAGLQAYLRERGRVANVRRCSELLARDRGPRPPDPDPPPAGARVWLPGDTLAAVRALALPGETDADTIHRLATRGPGFY